MNQHITARLDALNPVEPPTVTLARALLARAQDDLRDQTARRAPEWIVDAYRYAVLRAHDRLEAAWHDAAAAAAR